MVKSLLATCRLIMSLNAILEYLRCVNVTRARSSLQVWHRITRWTQSIHLTKHGSLLVLAANDIHILQHYGLLIANHDAHLLIEAVPVHI